MRLFFLSLFLFILQFSTASAQTARLQIIHNSPDPTVDIYVNGSLFQDDFEFRTATPFVDVPAGVPLSVAIAPGNSNSVADAIATYPLTLADGVTYAVTASGVVGNAQTPFDLIIDDEAIEEAVDPSKVALHVLHGAPDAPAVDVAVRRGGTLISNLSFGESAGYLEVDPGVYYLDVKPAGSSTIVATFKADLSGLAGAAARVYASGFLGQNPGFGLFAALPDGATVELPASPIARVQVIHNSPSPTVDIYINGENAIDDFDFRTATPFIYLPAETMLDVAIAPGNSQSVADAIATYPLMLTNGMTYAITASGVVGNAQTPFDLIIDDEAIEEAVDPSKVALHVLHGSPDAPAVDVAVRKGGTLIGNLSYGESAGYLEVDPDVYYLDIKPAGSADIVATFKADLSGLAGAAARVYASGFLGQDPGFGLFAALPDGVTVELTASPVARVQVVHNSPSPTVDIYINGENAIDDFDFRTATPFIYLPAETMLDVAVAPGNSQSVADAIATFPVEFENGGTYIVIANGIVGDPTTPFTLDVITGARELAGNPNEVTLGVFHGSPTAPAVDVVPFESSTAIVSDLSYGEFAGYLDLPADSYFLDIVPNANPNVNVGTWGADLSAAPGFTGLVLASGLPGGTPSFGLYVVLPGGEFLPMTAYARAQVIHNSPDVTVDVYLDHERLLDDFEFRTATSTVLLPADSAVAIAVAPSTSSTVDDAIYTLDVPGLETGKTYIIMAAGVVGNMDTPFDLYINENGRYQSTTGSGVDLILFHGSPDAPGVDVQVQGGTPILFDDVFFGEYSEYINVPAASYILDVTPSDNNDAVVLYSFADLTPIDGQSATVFASGYLGGDSPVIEIWVALADGTTFPLTPYLDANDLEGTLSQMRLSPNPATDRLNVQFDLEESKNLRYRIRDINGRMVQEADWGTMGSGFYTQEVQLSDLQNGFYILEILSENGMKSTKFVVQK
jgi:hypothetical protein